MTTTAPEALHLGARAEIRIAQRVLLIDGVRPEVLSSAHPAPHLGLFCLRNEPSERLPPNTLSPAGNLVYNATKSAVDGITRTLAKELGPRKIRVNSVNPGPIETEGAQAAGLSERFKAFAAVTPLGRVGQPDDIAPAVVFIASEDSHWITGESLYVTGGLR